MAKPILIIKSQFTDKEFRDLLTDASKAIETKLNNEYHVLVVIDHKIEEDNVLFEVLNDCKGARDEDIKQMIDELKDLYKHG